ncbi:tetraacyldisaccharide 4'-kinase [Tenacibaculum pacificus]|uniref:tetraacyldisaccharide 4'-kinase n=1 Tax=Tenacibaculum pacificus TaxID=3018314 RepID=UPI0022F3D5F8|nr:tetraacyldisaccharide 4'-kinase [Tenacibaculum pacificus]WBX74256.1 tetraacyldisaccharide 4'-kinase [Tenacibaculum pacificus]
MKLLRFLLFPFAILYDVITTIRNWFFDINVLKSTSFKVPVISVGNLSVGGTGKSPQIEFLIRLLKDDYKVAVLSRGYKRKTEGFQLLNDTHSAADVGDEPLQFYTKFKNDATIAVDADRTNGIQNLLKNDADLQVVLLDDAYQHRKVTASTSILLTKYNDLYIDDFIVPTGNLREARRGAKRAKIIIVTKCPENLSEEKQQEIIKKIKPKAHQQVFFTTISYDENLKGLDTDLTISDLKNKEVLLVTGIANPVSLLQFLSEEKISYKHLKYPDHYDFKTSDVEKIKMEFNQLPSDNKIILTTEKDYMRLQYKLQNVCYVCIKSAFLNNEEIFNDFIITQIKC